MAGAAKGKGGGKKKKKQKFLAPAAFVDSIALSRRVNCLRVTVLPGPVEPSHQPTPLHMAVRAGDFNTVKFLLANGCDVNVVDAIGSTPMHWAVAYGQRSMLHYLLSKGGNIDYANDWGVTILHAAVVRGELDLVQFLLKKNAQINTHDYWGTTPLITACINDDLLIVCALLNIARFVEEKKPDEENQHENQENAAAPENDERDPEEIERELRRKRRQEERERKEREALEKEKEEQDKLNAEKWAKTGEKDKAGWTALHHASARGHAEIVRVLVRAGADKNALDSRTGETPLHKAILHGRFQCVRYLEGADVNIRSHDGIPLIVVAAIEGYAAIFQWLVEQGADHKFVDSNGLTVLHHAAAHDRLSIVRFLVTNLGENLHVKDKEGRKPLMLAHDDTVKQFLQRRMLGELTTGDELNSARREKSLADVNSEHSLNSPSPGATTPGPQMPVSSRPSTQHSSSAH